MPSTSKKQHNFMEAIAHNPSFAKKVGVPQSVGQDFSAADKGRKFAKGGDTMATKGVNPFAKFEKSGKDVEVKGKGKEGSKKEEAFDKSQMGMKKGGMAMGGPTGGADPRVAAMLAAKMRGGAPARPAADPRVAAMLAAKMRGGAPAPASGMPMKKGGMAKYATGGFVRAADGIAQKGKTKAKQIKMAGGGKC